MVVTMRALLQRESIPGGSGGGGGGGSSSTTFVGSGNTITDTSNKSSETAAWRFEGFSGADTFTGGSGNDVFWGAIDGDTLTGNAGQDVFYFGDFTEGKDTITDFVVGGSGDVLKFGGSFAGSYTRDATVVSDSGANGTTYNMATNSGVLPKFLTLPHNLQPQILQQVLKTNLPILRLQRMVPRQFQTVLTLL